MTNTNTNTGARDGAPFGPGTTTPGYAFSNRSLFARAHHRALAAQFDDIVLEFILRQYQLSLKRVLDVATGAGSMALRFAELVGSAGTVTATDIEPDLVPPHPRLRLLRHNVVNELLPDEQYGLVHCRFLLNHLEQREAVVDKLHAATEPGGLLVLADMYPWPADDFVIAAPTLGDAELLRRFQTINGRVLAGHGVDPDWSWKAAGVLVDKGLRDVQFMQHGTQWRGGGAGTQLLAATLRHLRHELQTAGMTGDQVDRVDDLLSDRRVLLRGHRLIITTGVRAGDRNEPASAAP
jgi:SAM-dependent methyltransferase